MLDNYMTPDKDSKSKKKKMGMNYEPHIKIEKTVKFKPKIPGLLKKTQ